MSGSINTCGRCKLPVWAHLLDGMGYCPACSILPDPVAAKANAERADREARK